MFRNLQHIVRTVEAGPAPFWFSPSSMAFFDTELERGVGDAGVLRGNRFLTSDCPPGGTRTWSVRECSEDGVIRTVGEFGGHETRDAALRAAFLDD